MTDHPRQTSSDQRRNLPNVLRVDAEFTRWIPTFDSNKYGLELKGTALRASAVGDRLRALEPLDPKTVAFVVVRLAATDRRDIREAMSAVVSASVATRVCLSVEYPVLCDLDSACIRDERVGLLLNIGDGTTPLSALTSDAIEALRIEPDYAQQLSATTRGALLLEMLRNLAHETGLASLGPSLQDGTENFGLPVRFDYVAEGTIVDVLAKHRLR